MLDTAVNAAIIATPIIIAVGFYFAYGQWQATRKARMAQVVISLMNIWLSPEMAESRRKVNESGSNLKKDYESADKANQIEAYSSLTQVINLFDGLGLLVAEGFLETSVAYDLFGKAEKTYHRIYEPMVTAREYEGYVPYFTKLHELFVKEEACRSKVKKPHAS